MAHPLHKGKVCHGLRRRHKRRKRRKKRKEDGHAGDADYYSDLANVCRDARDWEGALENLDHCTDLEWRSGYFVWKSDCYCKLVTEIVRRTEDGAVYDGARAGILQRRCMRSYMRGWDAVPWQDTHSGTSYMARHVHAMEVADFAAEYCGWAAFVFESQLGAHPCARPAGKGRSDLFDHATAAANEATNELEEYADAHFAAFALIEHARNPKATLRAIDNFAKAKHGSSKCVLRTIACVGAIRTINRLPTQSEDMIWQTECCIKRLLGRMRHDSDVVQDPEVRVRLTLVAFEVTLRTGNLWEASSCSDALNRSRSAAAAAAAVARLWSRALRAGITTLYPRGVPHRLRVPFDRSGGMRRAKEWRARIRSRLPRTHRLVTRFKDVWKTSMDRTTPFTWDRFFGEHGAGGSAAEAAAEDEDEEDSKSRSAEALATEERAAAATASALLAEEEEKEARASAAAVSQKRTSTRRRNQRKKAKARRKKREQR